jgi:hypothetical protein
MKIWEPFLATGKSNIATTSQVGIAYMIGLACDLDLVRGHLAQNPNGDAS